MSYTPTTWVDQVVEKPATYTLQDNGDGTYTLIPAFGTVTHPGTRVNAAALNNIEGAIHNIDQNYLRKDGSVEMYNPLVTPGVKIKDDMLVNGIVELNSGNVPGGVQVRIKVTYTGGEEDVVNNFSLPPSTEAAYSQRIITTQNLWDAQNGVLKAKRVSDGGYSPDTDLDTVHEIGVYMIAGNFTTANHYPVQTGDGRAIFEVCGTDSGNHYFYQKFHDLVNGNTYIRYYNYNAFTTDWKKVTVQ